MRVQGLSLLVDEQRTRVVRTEMIERFEARHRIYEAKKIKALPVAHGRVPTRQVSLWSVYWSKYLPTVLRGKSTNIQWLVSIQIHRTDKKNFVVIIYYISMRFRDQRKGEARKYSVFLCEESYEMLLCDSCGSE